MRLQLLLLFYLSITLLAAEIPPGYYDTAAGLSGTTLKAALNDIIQDHTEYSYDDLRDFILPDTDEDPQNSSNIILVYTGRSQPKSTFGGDPDDWNREHVWAKSHGDFGDSPPYGTDAHQMHPCDASVNSTRGNKDFDNGGTAVYDLGYLAGYTDADSWEPRDEVKGDIARVIFYMDVRYEGENGELDLTAVDGVNTAPEPEHGNLAALYQWHLDDPPDDWERNRNDKVYFYQNNRNPFIDHPEFANYIWGGEEPEDIFPPVITSVQATGSTTVLVDFSETVSELTAETAANYAIDNGIGQPLSAERGAAGDDSTVLLTVSPLVSGTEYTLTVNNVEDLFGNPILPGSQASFSWSDTVILLSASFEEGTGGWQLLSSASAENWFRTNSTGSTYPANVPNGGYYMYINNYGADNPANDWLITPALDLSDFSSAAASFYLWTKYGDSIPGLEILASANYSGDPAAASWTALPVTLPAPGSNTWVWREEISLADFAGEDTIHLSFHYTSTGTGAGTTTAWAVDAVQVTGTTQSGQLPAPSNLGISLAGGTVFLSWSPVSGASAYKIYSAADPSLPLAQWNFLTAVPGTSWSGTASDGRKFYQVTAE